MIIDLRLQRAGSPSLSELNHVIADDTRSQFDLNAGRIHMRISLELSGVCVTVVACPGVDGDPTIRWSGPVRPHPRRWHGLPLQWNQTKQQWTCFIRCINTDVEPSTPTP